MSPLPTVFSVSESSQISGARRASGELAELLGWDETLTGKLELVITEAGTNLVKHAKAGEIHVRRCESDGIEILALDRGPGMNDDGASLKDGYSTAGTSGTGLGAIRRLSTEFDIYSQPGKGTALVSRIYPKGSPPAGFEAGVVQVPVKGETVCGDSWGIREHQGRIAVLLADGLGHGAGAASASQAAIRVLFNARDFEPVALLSDVHLALRPTRGAAVAVAIINPADGELQFAGVGNISAAVLTGHSTQHLVSHNGTAGQVIRKIQSFAYPWSRQSLLILHSDGLNTSWRLDSYPGLARKHPSLVAATLFRDAARGRDDVCVVALRSLRESRNDG